MSFCIFSLPGHPVLPPPQSFPLSTDPLLLCSWITCWFSTQLVCSIKEGLSGVDTRSSSSLKTLLYIASSVYCEMQSMAKINIVYQTGVLLILQMRYGDFQLWDIGFQRHLCTSASERETRGCVHEGMIAQFSFSFH